MEKRWRCAATMGACSCDLITATQRAAEAYWALVESYRTQRGPRQRTVAYLGLMDEAGRLGVEQVVAARVPAPTRPVSAGRDGTAVRRDRPHGSPRRELPAVRRAVAGAGTGQATRAARVLAAHAPPQREHVPWSLTALILVVARLCEPSSELHIAEHFYRQSALGDLLGVPVDQVDDNRLYRGLDKLLPHKAALETFLKQRFGELFAIEYDLLLYDVTSTYFEGQAAGNPWPNAATRAIIGRTASRSASAWW